MDKREEKREPFRPRIPIKVEAEKLETHYTGEPLKKQPQNAGDLAKYMKKKGGLCRQTCAIWRTQPTPLGVVHIANGSVSAVLCR